MKVISILQPWATLVAIGAKKIETRSWNTNYRGPLLIHASKREITMAETSSKMMTMVFKEFIRPNDYMNLSYGAIIGCVEVVGTFKMNDARKQIDQNLRWPICGTMVDFSEKEIAFGDFSPNRYGWLLSNPVSFKHHLPVKGKLGLWELDKRICHSCGCWDENCIECIKETGRPCSWAGPNLCSACKK